MQFCLTLKLPRTCFCSLSLFDTTQPHMVKSSRWRQSNAHLFFFGPENTTSKHQPKKGNAHAPREANANKLSYESLPLQLTSIIVMKRFDTFWESVTEAVHVQMLIDVIAATFQALPIVLSRLFPVSIRSALQEPHTDPRHCRFV